MSIPWPKDELFLPGKTNLLLSAEENVGMVAGVQMRIVSKSLGENSIILRIGVAQNPPVQLTELAEISLSLTPDQAEELADLLNRFVEWNEFPEESVRFEFKGDTLSKAQFAPTAYVKRPHSSSVCLPVEARLTRRGKGAVTMALEAPKQDEDGVWLASVSVTRSKARLFVYMILVNWWRVEANSQLLRRG
jgi:hypothetical protein